LQPEPGHLGISKNPYCFSLTSRLKYAGSIEKIEPAKNIHINLFYSLIVYIQGQNPKSAYDLIAKTSKISYIKKIP